MVCQSTHTSKAILETILWMSGITFHFNCLIHLSHGPFLISSPLFRILSQRPVSLLWDVSSSWITLSKLKELRTVTPHSNSLKYPQNYETYCVCIYKVGSILYSLQPITVLVCRSPSSSTWRIFNFKLILLIDILHHQLVKISQGSSPWKLTEDVCIQKEIFSPFTKWINKGFQTVQKDVPPEVWKTFWTPKYPSGKEGMRDFRGHPPYAYFSREKQGKDVFFKPRAYENSLVFVTLSLIDAAMGR